MILSEAFLFPTQNYEIVHFPNDKYLKLMVANFCPTAVYLA